MAVSAVSNEPLLPIKILVLNPNSSEAMTRGMREAITKINLNDAVKVTTCTAPQNSPASINDGSDIQASSEAAWRGLDHDYLLSFDAVLVACYSVHPLVSLIAAAQQQSPSPNGRACIGIFEASVWTALSLLPPDEIETAKWGIVTTGPFWEAHLAEGVQKLLLGREAGPRMRPTTNGRFAGVFAAGMNASDFHEEPSRPPNNHNGANGSATRNGNAMAKQTSVQGNLARATKSLLQQGDGKRVRCVVMGCAGMSGLEETIRGAVIEEYGQDEGSKVLVIDGVRAGVCMLEQMVRNKRMFGS